MSVQDLRQSPMMTHLLNALERNQSIGHYGRLVFAMIARHFIPDDELVGWVKKDPRITDDEARALVLQVKGKDYSPPRRERILEWQRQQEFAICPEPDNPDACNIYKDLKFPPEVYEHIGGYYEQKAESKS